MTPEQVAQQFYDAEKALAEQFPDIIQEIANDAKALVQKRIQDTGIDANGNKLPGYSTTELPSFFLNAKKKKTKSYKDLREERGLQTEYVDLTFTGGMFRNLQIVDTSINGNKYVVTVGGDAPGSQNKIDWNSDRYGDILRVSQKEEEGLKETYDDSIQKIINQFL